MAERIDWPAMRLNFITDPSRPTIREWAGKQGIAVKTAQNRASLERWQEDREAHWESVGKKATERVADLQAGVVASDMAQRLVEIRRMQGAALRAAGGDADDAAVFYEKPHEAVAAYERLVKLERLLMGESTEHIKVDDARAFARDVLLIVREEVLDRDTLERIAARLAALSVGSGPQRGTAQLN